MMQKVKILPFSQEQLPAAAALAQRCFPDPWSLALFEAAFSQPDTTLFAAMAGDTLAGYLILQRLGDEESVDDIAVAPTAAGNGTRSISSLSVSAGSAGTQHRCSRPLSKARLSAGWFPETLLYQSERRCGTDDPTPTIKGGTPCNKPSNW